MIGHYLGIPQEELWAKLNDGTGQKLYFQEDVDALLMRATVHAFDQACEAIDECHRRNISGENWHSRVSNFVRAEGDRRIAALEKVIP